MSSTWSEVVVVVLMSLLLGPLAVQGAEEATGEPMEREPAGAVPSSEPSAEQVGHAIRAYIDEVQMDEGDFTMDDEVTGELRTLELVQVHEHAAATAHGYTMCTDMRDVVNGDVVDVDFDVEWEGGEPFVIDTRIHKVNGREHSAAETEEPPLPLAD